MTSQPKTDTPYSSGTLRLRGTDVRTVTRDVPYTELRFYVDNPRIYSFVRSDGYTPTQGEILKRLQGLDHVRELVQDIKSNGGLIDPLIVRNGDMVVLEGNSRLAAYHYLASQDQSRWGKVRCTLLPEDIDEKLVYALLAQYHVKGKKDWAPYEKAGFVYRRFNEHRVDLPDVAVELGLTKDQAKHLISVYQFMIDHADQDREHWSYYDELLKSRKIKKVSEEVPGFEDFIVGEVKASRIGKAMDLRDKLPTICAANPRILKRYMNGTYDFAEAHEVAVTAGGESHTLNKLKRFRNWLVAASTEDDLVEAPKAIRDSMQYELKEIEKKSKKLKDLLEQKKNAIN
ncbi:ParB N-terminal domain-containing protein [Mesorhizobium sp.]|uniref:ParB N-terminal domain-containing protein n=1 Tax=Mesorhizobium sp. TaxID=1871066 RepID=UPI000FE3BFB6|nr:ParB N-terminal domain-containing protein [Mesorhizobium sp.]RWN59374.1 MAG: hypothetical protein EOR98_03085 [Mesorhizobium sp.]RWN80880.1 MAG: hypothetical protein EOS02_03080 [Mesorhizobium sp.]RWN83333.1 MAG: hypothetical protein EOS01_03260 [Mesorhizobium sp.]RWN86771.1 MAG: hypothetical protein EOS04_17900 [Mesorhizobium sp.]RWO16406.1 MAG: hypothetical protein EOS15_05295 [Mesorhizobium sp.]